MRNCRYITRVRRWRINQKRKFQATSRQGDFSSTVRTMGTRLQSARWARSPSRPLMTVLDHGGTRRESNSDLAYMRMLEIWGRILGLLYIED